MADVFIAYAREDRERIEALAAALERAGFEVWWDRNLTGGEPFSQVLEAQVLAATTVLAAWSRSSRESIWVADEADVGLRQRKLVPICIDSIEPPIGFRQLHTIDFTNWNGGDDESAFQELTAALRLHIETPGMASSGPRYPIKLKSDANAGFQPHGPSQQQTLPVFGKVSRRNLLVAGATIGGLALAVGGAAFFGRSGSLLENGVAVLPFRNSSGDPDQDYLSLGLAAEVRSLLARNSALRVVAEVSCEAVADRKISAAEIAKLLSVSFILDGSLRRAGDRLRLVTELIEGRTGFTRWSATFDHSIEELTSIQETISHAVTRELALTGSKSQNQDQYGSTTNAVAFNEYQKGKELFAAALSYESDLSALAHFDRAIERDPSFGAAYAARARSLTVLGNTSDSIEKANAFYGSAYQAATRAVKSGPSSADAHSTLGYVLFQAMLRIKEARASYERSYELGPGEATVVARFAGYAAATGRDSEAQLAVHRARDLDPLNATIHRAVGFVHFAAGRYELSIESVEKALSLNPDLSDSHARIAMALVALGRTEDALEAATREKSGLFRYSCLAIVHHLLGHQDQADKAFEALKNAYGQAGLYQQAQILSVWGKEAEAISTLMRARQLGDSGLTYAFVDPSLDRLRSKPEFRDLILNLGYG